MDRYILQEMVPPFLFGVGTFSSLGVSVGSLFYLVNQVVDAGLPLTTAMHILLLRLPEFVVYSFPASTLLAGLMTFSRFSSDSEMIALRGCGVSIYRMAIAPLFFCLLVTGLTFTFNESLVPAANYEAKSILRQALKDNRPAFRQRDIVYQEFGDTQVDGEKRRSLQRIFYSREFDGQQMKGLTILDFSREGLDQIVSANSAVWNFEQGVWDFYDGTIYIVSADGSFRNIVKFDHQQLKLPRAPLDLAQNTRDYNEMNIAQSLEYLEVLQQTGNEAKIRELKVRIQQKYALPFVCVAFGLVGVALGAQLRRTGRATGFAISILLIFTYYLMAFIFGAIAQTGGLSPFWGAWLPNLFGLLIAAVLLHRASR
ncbi:MAG TPA: LptF/LptG family permease [Synechococcales cyanobacterium M55_K2018_004]|nr:LptF/LptG family permease [Synechococcales cyanobacterium M55_K2018_004]